MQSKETYKISQRLLTTRDAYVFFCRKLVNNVSLTEQQWRVLKVLSDYGTVDTGTIAKRCNFLSPSLTGILKRLESSGLVYRHRTCKDQRRIKVSITETGREIVAKISPEIDSYHQKIEKMFTKNKTQKLLILLDELENLTKEFNTQESN